MNLVTIEIPDNFPQPLKEEVENYLAEYKHSKIISIEVQDNTKDEYLKYYSITYEILVDDGCLSIVYSMTIYPNNPDLTEKKPCIWYLTSLQIETFVKNSDRLKQCLKKYFKKGDV
jgi:hypothetical protein